MATETENVIKRLAEEVGELRDHTNYARWHSRLRRALKRQDHRFWPTLTGANEPPLLHELSVPDENVVREILADRYHVPWESISSAQVASYINTAVHQPNAALRTWQVIDQKLLPLFLVSLGSHLHFHVRLAKTGSEAYRIIEGMFDGLARQYVWTNWIHCTLGAYKTAPIFVSRWHRALNEVLYLFENDAPSASCQFCQFMVAVDGHPNAGSWKRVGEFDMDDPALMDKVFQSFLSSSGQPRTTGRVKSELRVHWDI